MSYIGAGASVVGGIMQSIAATQENKAMMAAFQQELKNQLGFQDQAYGSWMGGLPAQGAEAAGKAIDTGASKAQGVYSQVNSMPLIAGGGSGSSPESGAYASTDKAALGQEGAVRSRIGGMSDWQLGKAINDIKTRDAINRVNFRSQGDAQVFPYKMYAAQHSQDELDFWGKTISSIGGGGGSGMSASQPPSMSQMQGSANPMLLDGGTGMYMPQGWNGQLPSMTTALPSTGFA